MILIPTWALLIEIAVLEGILAVVYVRYKSHNVGRMAGIFLVPNTFAFVMYFLTEFVSLEEARILARYTFSIYFFTMIVMFGRVLWARMKR